MYLSTKEVMKLFGWTSRSMVGQTARREGWRKIKGSRPRMYLASDVQEYKVSREHIRLAHPGHISYHLIRHKDGYSDKCLICNP